MTHSGALKGLGSTRACSGPTQAASVAARPHMRTNQNTRSWWVIRRITMPGTIAAVQIVSLRKDWPPRPAAKNA